MIDTNLKVPVSSLKKGGRRNQVPSLKPSSQRLGKRFLKERWLYIMALPGILFFLIYKYVPMWGIILAFKDYYPFLGLAESEWVGLKHFIRFVSHSAFPMLMRNTLLIGLYNLIFFFPLPIILSVLLNEIRSRYYKRTMQTMIYVPHFMSWVVVVSIFYIFLTTEGGFVNNIIFAISGNKINFLLSEAWFRPLIVMQVIWKETGWGTIIFLATLSSIDPQLYESAIIDGANRGQQMWYITLPALKSTIVILLILRLGNFLDTGFDQIYNMLNPLNRAVGEVFDTYVYTVGISQGLFSYSTAVGLFKSLIGLILVYLANTFARRIGEEGIF